jgi:DNA-binding transcriptional ArsR family regulator
MESSIWIGLESVKELAEKLDQPAIAEKVDAILAGVMETVADVLPAAPVGQLREGAMSAKAALERVERAGGVNETSSSYIAGRLAAAADVLGYASFQTADDAAVEIAREQPYAGILAILAEGALRNVDLATKLRKDEPRVSKWLAALRGAGAVTSHKRGRETFNALTPVGRLVVEKGHVDANRRPIDSANVFTMGAYGRGEFDLSRLPTPVGVTREYVPTLSASGG